MASLNNGSDSEGSKGHMASHWYRTGLHICKLGSVYDGWICEIVVSICHMIVEPQYFTWKCTMLLILLKQSLDQGNMLRGRAICCPATCCADEQHVASNEQMLLVAGNIVACILATLYPFVSSNRWATNWQQFCWRQQATCCRQHVAG